MLTIHQLFDIEDLDRQFGPDSGLIPGDWMGTGVGITGFQVVALVHWDDRLLLVDGGRWTLPVVWVRPTETVSGALDRLCGVHLGLEGWKASFAATAVCPSPDGGMASQFGFDVVLGADVEPVQPGPCRWWQPVTEPVPLLHPWARPLMERLYSFPCGDY